MIKYFFSPKRNNFYTGFLLNYIRLSVDVSYGNDLNVNLFIINNYGNKPLGFLAYLASDGENILVGVVFT
jgi:hypothetical protein